MGLGKASDVLAHELRERILSGEIPEGAGLPPERELVKQTQMSRATVREALRILEVQDLVQVKAGRAGGAFVQRPGIAAMASAVSIVIRGRGFAVADVLETLAALEPYCAELAASKRIESDLETLDQANESIANTESDPARFLQATFDWHVGIAIASHNELLIGFITALLGAIYVDGPKVSLVDGSVRTMTARAHRAITEAIRNKDADAAGRRMRTYRHPVG